MPPPVQITHTGIIEVHNAANGDLLGYVSKNMVNGGAQLGYDPSITNALLTTFQTDSTGSGTDIDITMTVCFHLAPPFAFSHFPLFRTQIRAGPCWVLSRVVMTVILTSHLDPSSKSWFVPSVPSIDVIIFIDTGILVVLPIVGLPSLSVT